MGVLLGDWEQGFPVEEPQVLRPLAFILHCHLVVGIDHCCRYLLRPLQNPAMPFLPWSLAFP